MKKLMMIFTFFLMIFKVSMAYASIGVNPHYIVIDANSKKRNHQVFFSNTGKETKNYRIKFVNYKQLKDGSYEEISEPLAEAPFAHKYLALSPNRTTLKANQSQTIRIQRKPMLNTDDGEYVSYLMITETDTKKPLKKSENSKGIKIEAKALYAATIPVIVRKGKLEANGSIKGAKVETVNKAKVLSVEIDRTGTKSLFVNIRVKNSKDKEIGRLNKVRVYLTSSSRVVRIPLTDYKANEKLKVQLLDAETDKEISAKSIN